MEHIVLPTFAYEHKVFAGPFARKFPSASLWIAPRQWSWPLNLPPPLLGLFRYETIQGQPADLEGWPAEIDFKVLSCPEVGE